LKENDIEFWDTFFQYGLPSFSVVVRYNGEVVEVIHFTERWISENGAENAKAIVTETVESWRERELK